MNLSEKKYIPLLSALASGLAVFFALESAIARRIGLDLFLPWSAGALLPGRLARLAACLVLGFALALTDRGRALSRALDRFCGREPGRWTVSAAVTALFFLWTLRVTVMAYMTMDDVTFVQAIAEIPEKGLGATASVFSSQLLCWFIGKLYALYPDGYWYLGYHLTVLLISVTVVGRCVLTKTAARRWPAWAGCAIHGLLCAGVFTVCFASIAFTVTPAIAGCAALALVLCRGQARTAAGRVCSDIAVIALMCLCILQRQETGKVLLCFWGVAAAYQLLRALLRHDGKKRLALFLVMSLATPLLVLGADSVELEPVDPNYSTAEYYRSLIGDFLKNYLTPEQYERAGIPRELGTLICDWCFMDERVTTDLFRQLADIYYADRAAEPQAAADSADGAGVGGALSTADAPSADGAVPAPTATASPLLDEPDNAAELLSQMGDSLRADRQILWRACCIAALLALCLALPLRSGRRYWPEALCALCTAGGALILALYLVGQSRLILRSALVVAQPAIVMLLLTAIAAPEEDAPAGHALRRRAAGALTALSGAAVTVCCVMCAYVTPTAADAVSRADVFALQTGMESLAASNPDMLFISGVFDHYNANTDPLHPLSTYPDNIVPWGYCGDTAKAPEDRLYIDVFLRDDTLFIFDELHYIRDLLQFLSLDHGPVQAQRLFPLSTTVSVAAISLVSPEEPGYTGWYEQNGLTYYFRDGQAVTGQQIIDGESYTFAPAGAAARFTAAPGPEGIVYTTDAYSLVTTEAETP